MAVSTRVHIFIISGAVCMLFLFNINFDYSENEKNIYRFLKIKPTKKMFQLNMFIGF